MFWTFIAGHSVRGHGGGLRQHGHPELRLYRRQHRQDLGDQGQPDPVRINFYVSWTIKTSKGHCQKHFALNRPPNGCLQYHTELDGRFQTFDNLNTQHINSQMYSVCIRQAEGYCCVQYEVCDNNAANYMLSTETATALVDSQCVVATEDFIIIEGGNVDQLNGMVQIMRSILDSSDVCQQGGVVGPTTDRYCGQILSNFPTATVNIPICGTYQLDIDTPYDNYCLELCVCTEFFRLHGALRGPDRDQCHRGRRRSWWETNYHVFPSKVY